MDVPVFKPSIGEKEKKQLAETVDSGWISSKGEATSRFEEKVLELTGGRHGYAVDSGTAGLRAALEALDVEGGEVIVPALTFGATAMAVKQAGAEPVPVDIESGTHGINPEKLEDAITENTEAVMPVHLFSQPCEMSAIKEIAYEHNLKVVEDSAQAMTSKYRGKNTGTIGDIGVYSFSWNKSITTAKGGFITTDDRELQGRIESIVRNGFSGERKFQEKGYNLRMDSLRASLGLSQLERYRELMEKRKQLYRVYEKQLKLPEEARKMKVTEEVDPWAYYIETDRREELIEHLSPEIGTRRFYRPVTQHGFVKGGKHPVAEKVSARGLMIPSYPDLEHEKAKKIAEKINEFY